MSTASNRNFGIAQRERERRLAELNDDPGNLSAAMAVNDPSWNAFFGALREQGDAARSQGLNYRADLSGLGQGTAGGPNAFMDGGGGLQYPSNQGMQQMNAAADALNTQNKVQNLAISSALDAKDQANRDAMRKSYEDQVAASMNAPPITDRVVQTYGPGGKTTYSTDPRSTDPRQQMLDRLPPAARLAAEQQMAATDATRVNTALAVRKEGAAEASNPLLVFKDANGGPLNLNDPTTGAPLQGASVLDRLPPSVRNQVQGVLAGKQQMPAGTASKDPYWKAIIQIANQVDPSFDAINYNARSKTRQEFTTGTAAKNINALNTVIGHLHDLSAAAVPLATGPMGNGGMDWLNAVRNKLTPGGSDRGVAINNFETLKEGVANELLRVWKQAGVGSEKEIEDWKSTIGASKSPQELQGAFKTIGGMLESKLGSLDSQYKEGMGTDAVTAITPDARKKLDALQGLGGRPVAPAGAGAPGAPAAGGIVVIDPRGGRHTFTDQAKADAFKQAAGIR